MPSLRTGAAMTIAAGLLIVLSVPWLLSSPSPTVVSFAVRLQLTWSFFCHQLPERTPTLAGMPCCACHRCTALFVGALSGCLLALCGGPDQPRTLRRLCLAGSLLLFADACLQTSGCYSSNGMRWVTGSLTGLFVIYSALRFIPVKGMSHG